MEELVKSLTEADVSTLALLALMIALLAIMWRGRATNTNAESHKTMAEAVVAQSNNALIHAESINNHTKATTDAMAMMTLEFKEVAKVFTAATEIITRAVIGWDAFQIKVEADHQMHLAATENIVPELKPSLDTLAEKVQENTSAVAHTGEIVGEAAIKMGETESLNDIISGIRDELQEMRIAVQNQANATIELRDSIFVRTDKLSTRLDDVEAAAKKHETGEMEAAKPEPSPENQPVVMPKDKAKLMDTQNLATPPEPKPKTEEKDNPHV